MKTMKIMTYQRVLTRMAFVQRLELFSFGDSATARALVKNPKAWGPGSLKFLFLNAGEFTPQQAEGPWNS